VFTFLWWFVVYGDLLSNLRRLTSRVDSEIGSKLRLIMLAYDDDESRLDFSSGESRILFTKSLPLFFGASSSTIDSLIKVIQCDCFHKLSSSQDGEFERVHRSDLG
jgi:hypothetical protein